MSLTNQRLKYPRLPCFFLSNDRWNFFYACVAVIDRFIQLFTGASVTGTGIGGGDRGRGRGGGDTGTGSGAGSGGKKHGGQTVNLHSTLSYPTQLPERMFAIDSAK